MLKEFKEFLEKFNVIPVAVGLVLALAFTPVVDAAVNLIMSIIGKAGGLETDFSSWAPADLPIGVLVTAIISFITMAFVVFMIVKALAKSGAKTEVDSGPSAEEVLLTEIRDLLAARRQ